VRHGREDYFETGLADDLSNLVGIGCDHDPVANVKVNQTPDHPRDEWFSGQEP